MLSVFLPIVFLNSRAPVSKAGDSAAVLDNCISRFMNILQIVHRLGVEVCAADH